MQLQNKAYFQYFNKLVIFQLPGMMKDFIDWILSKYAQREHVRNKMLARWNRLMGFETKTHNQFISSPGKSPNAEVNVMMLRL